MTRYLEEAAALLRKSAETNEKANRSYPGLANDGRLRIAREFAALAAIDKGLLPAEMVQDVLRAITIRAGA